MVLEKSCAPSEVHELAVRTKKDGDRKMLEQHLQDRPQKDEDTCKKNWDTLKDCIVTAAEELLGRERRKQPE